MPYLVVKRKLDYLFSHQIHIEIYVGRLTSRAVFWSWIHIFGARTEGGEVAKVESHEEGILEHDDEVH